MECYWTEDHFHIVIEILNFLHSVSPPSLKTSNWIGASREGRHFPGSSAAKASACNTGDLGSIPGLGRSPGEGNGNPLQYSCLENPMDGGAWWAKVHRVTKSRTQLSDFTFKGTSRGFPWFCPRSGTHHFCSRSMV